MNKELHTENYKAIDWVENKIIILDQTLLPNDEVYLTIDHWEEMIGAIKFLKVRGAPTLGVAGAYTIALAALEFMNMPYVNFSDNLKNAAEKITNSRPTAVNLSWAIKRCMNSIDKTSNPKDIFMNLLIQAKMIQTENLTANIAIGKYGASLLSNQSRILTHCNAGALATAGFGTALGIIRSAWQQGKLTEVYSTETRPLFQGSRLTAWELQKSGIPVTTIIDNMAGVLMANKIISGVIVGADRIASNGDVANKIGTYTLAILAKEHSIPFYVAAPSSTIDFEISSGNEIIIEERDSAEVDWQINGRLSGSLLKTNINNQDTSILNYAFDVTPHQYINAIITEKGIMYPKYSESLERLAK